METGKKNVRDFCVSGPRLFFFGCNFANQSCGGNITREGEIERGIERDRKREREKEIKREIEREKEREKEREREMGRVGTLN